MVWLNEAFRQLCLKRLFQWDFSFFQTVKKSPSPPEDRCDDLNSPIEIPNSDLVFSIITLWHILTPSGDSIRHQQSILSPIWAHLEGQFCWLLLHRIVNCAKFDEFSRLNFKFLTKCRIQHFSCRGSLLKLDDGNLCRLGVCEMFLSWNSGWKWHLRCCHLMLS